MLEICFVLAPGQNTFFTELAEAICDELRLSGYPARISTEGFPAPREDLVYVLLPPHEYYALEGLEVEPTWQVLKRSVFICCEQPGTHFFDLNVFLADRAGAVFDISRAGVEEFTRRGFPDVRHFQLGWTERWSAVDYGPDQQPDSAERDIDVLHLGIHTGKRARDLAVSGEWLWNHNTAIVIGDEGRPNASDRQNWATGANKWQLLRRSRVLLNLHQEERPYFEWLRVVQAIACGCAVVSEHSVDYEPLVPGEHILFGRADALALLAQELIEDDDRRFEQAQAAWRFLEAELPLSAAARALAEAAEEVSANPLPPDGRAERFRKPEVAIATASDDAEPFPSDVESRDESVLRAAAKDIHLDLLALRRQMTRMTLRDERGDWPPPFEREAESPAWPDAAPTVSFVVALYNHAEHVQRALESAARSHFTDIEIVVTDDGSTDGSGEAVRDWMTRRPDIPTLLLRHPVNRGPGAARNTALEFARGTYAFVLDADNEVYPTTLDKLIAALERDPDAVFAYGMLGMFTAQGAVGLRSYYPWQPERFRRGNPIDAMALIRRDWLVANGAYTTDLRLHGWEDYDLWCRVAERGGRGVQTPEIVGRYRAATTSMLAVTDISSRQAVGLLIERHPELMRGVEPPL